MKGRIATLATAVVIGLAACSGGNGGTTSKATTPGPLDSLTAAPSGRSPIATVAPIKGAGAGTPADAVRAFLDASIGRDAARSLGLLRGAERTAVGSVAEWAGRQVDLPTYTSYRLDGDAPSPAGATEAIVTTEVTLVPRLDPVVGLQPAAARVTWRTVQEDGQWFVDLTASQVEPRYADVAGADAAALTWAGARQACRTDAEWDGGLVGLPDLADGLCHLTGTYAVDRSGPLTDLRDPTPVLNAFGPDAGQWARVVRLTGPEPLETVLAPVGDRWLVVGVLPA